MFCPASESLVTLSSFINEENTSPIIGIAMFTLLRVPSGLSSINASYLINIIMSERLENVMSRYMYLMNILKKKLANSEIVIEQ